MTDDLLAAIIVGAAICAFAGLYFCFRLVRLMYNKCRTRAPNANAGPQGRVFEMDRSEATADSVEPAISKQLLYSDDSTCDEPM